MTQTSTPRPQISPSEAETLRTHARTIVEGEGAEDFSPALVEAVARALAEAEACHANDWRWFVEGARAALSTIRKHQAGE